MQQTECSALAWAQSQESASPKAPLLKQRSRMDLRSYEDFQASMSPRRTVRHPASLVCQSHRLLAQQCEQARVVPVTSPAGRLNRALQGLWCSVALLRQAWRQAV